MAGSPQKRARRDAAEVAARRAAGGRAKRSTRAERLRVLAFYVSHGITVERLLTDNGSAYRSSTLSNFHAIACRALRIKHVRTRPYRPQTNGKAERFIRTMLGGWAYGAIYRDSAERTAALPGWLELYNWRRPHGALNRKPPGTRLHELNNVLGSYT